MKIEFDPFHEGSFSFRQFYNKKIIILENFSFKMYHLRLKFPELIIYLREVIENDNSFYNNNVI